MWLIVGVGVVVSVCCWVQLGLVLVVPMVVYCVNVCMGELVEYYIYYSAKMGGIDGELIIKDR